MTLIRKDVKRQMDDNYNLWVRDETGMIYGTLLFINTQEGIEHGKVEETAGHIKLFVNTRLRNALLVAKTITGAN